MFGANNFTFPYFLNALYGSNNGVAPSQFRPSTPIPALPGRSPFMSMIAPQQPAPRPQFDINQLHGLLSMLSGLGQSPSSILERNRVIPLSRSAQVLPFPSRPMTSAQTRHFPNQKPVVLTPVKPVTQAKPKPENKTPDIPRDPGR